MTATRIVENHAGVRIGRATDGDLCDFSGVRIGRVTEDGEAYDYSRVHIGHVAGHGTAGGNGPREGTPAGP